MKLHLPPADPREWAEISHCEDDDFQLGVASWRLNPGEHKYSTQRETAIVLMSGAVKFPQHSSEVHRRTSLFDENPTCLHLPAHTELSLFVEEAAELMVYDCPNQDSFSARLFLPEQVRHEDRGKGLLHGGAHRIVRTIFDGENSPQETHLVLGEVINFPGRWSSYPPHHHDQPEIYHYRFDKPQGYGHAEVGEQVFKVRHGESIKIVPGEDHSQCSAPGYAMYYSWVIRHLPNNPYTVPEFTEEHRWCMDKDADCWWKSDA